MDTTARLRELIAALDRRLPRPSAPDEPRIAREAKELRALAVEQLGRIERANTADGRAEPVGRKSSLERNDIVVSRVRDGHNISIVSATPSDPISLVYRGDGWNVQYAVARGARLASSKGGRLWYTIDDFMRLEYLETFRATRREKAG